MLNIFAFFLGDNHAHQNQKSLQLEPEWDFLVYRLSNVNNLIAQQEQLTPPHLKYVLNKCSCYAQRLLTHKSCF